MSSVTAEAPGDAAYQGPPFREGDHQSVVRWFAAGWDGSASVERFCDHFQAGMHPDVRLMQPGTRTVVGHRAFRSLFEGLFSLTPDLRADVHRWAPSGDSVYIEFTLSGTVGGRRPVSWPAVDRLVVRDGLLSERRSWFDPGTLFAAIARHPPSWPRAARMLAGNLGRR
jgi:ketosteroid isomerase-like protein